MSNYLLISLESCRKVAIPQKCPLCLWAAVWLSYKGFWRNVTLGWVGWCHKRVRSINQSELIKLSRIKPASLAEEALSSFSLVAEKPPGVGWQYCKVPWASGASEGFATIILAHKTNESNVSSVILLHNVSFWWMFSKVSEAETGMILHFCSELLLLYELLLLFGKPYLPWSLFLLWIPLLQAESHRDALKQCCVSIPPTLACKVTGNELFYRTEMRSGRNNSFFNLVALCAQAGWNQGLPPPSCESELEHPQTCLGSSLALFGARKSERRDLTPGEDSHKGCKATQRWLLYGSFPFST